MAIIISENGKNAKRVEESNFALEDKLQEYIYDNPEAIPLYDIDQDTRLLIAAREFATKSGPIDALGFDATGNIYVVETKLYKNPDKRTVVAQALDYGASLWRNAIDFDDFLYQLDIHCQKQFNQSFNTKYADFFQLEDATESINTIKSNLADGSIKFVVLMDKLHDALKDLVIFVNQNSKFDLYAVELEYYRHKSFEIIIPKLYGAEVKKDVTSVSGKQNKTKWDPADESAFWDDLQHSYDNGILSDQAYAGIKELVEICKNMTIKTGGRNTFWRVTMPNRESIRFFINDSSDRVTMVIESDGRIAAYKYDKQGPQVDFINEVLDQIIKNKLFKKTDKNREGAQWFISLDKSAASVDEVEKFVQINKQAFGNLKI